MNLTELIRLAYAEDIPGADITTDNLGLNQVIGDAKLVAKEDLVLSGRDVFDACVRFQCNEMTLKWQFKDGDFVLKGQTLCWLRGDLIRLLRAERVALNFLGHLSGVASLTRCYVFAVKGTHCKILDTRKTTPLLRELEKAAVLAGGGSNHRMNLSSGILIKENHIRACGGIDKAVEAIRTQTSEAIEVECLSIEDVDQAVAAGAARVLLDNMSTVMMAEAMKRVPPSITVEASGNMTLERVKEVAETGVHYISVGALTHSAPVADMSLLFEWTAKT